MKSKKNPTGAGASAASVGFFLLFMRIDDIISKEEYA